MNFWSCHTTTYVKVPNQSSPRDLPIDLARTARRTAVRYWILAMLFAVSAFSKAYVLAQLASGWQRRRRPRMSGRRSYIAQAAECATRSMSCTPDVISARNASRPT